MVAEISEDEVNTDNFTDYILQRREKLAPLINYKAFNDLNSAKAREVSV